MTNTKSNFLTNPPDRCSITISRFQKFYTQPGSSIFQGRLIRVILALMIVLSAGCSSQDAAVSGSNESRQIVDIIIDENPDSLILGIRGNQKLIHTENRQADPEQIVLYFPDTGLDSVRGRFVPPDNEIISSIIATERVENETTNSTIYIALKLDSPYAITPDKDRLLITFSKKPTLPEKNKPQKKPAKDKPEPQSAKPAIQSVPVATALRTVHTEALENSVAVKIEADGTIKKYKAFRLINPDRIVFDLYGIKSPYYKEQKIAVQSEWIKRIRYFGYPHKLRLVIETLKNSGSTYSTVPSDTGLIIHVGAK
jgi:hypothetical protein